MDFENSTAGNSNGRFRPLEGLYVQYLEELVSLCLPANIGFYELHHFVNRSENFLAFK